MDNHNYIKARGIWYDTAIRGIKKKDENLLQPIFEAFTNSLEAINILKERHDNKEKGNVTISLFFTKNLLSKETKHNDFRRIEIYDTGVGFDKKEFERFVALRDNRKGYSNKGTGRVQFLHTFDKTEISSIYRDSSSSTGFKERKLTLSKSKPFLTNNAIIRLEADFKKHNADSLFSEEEILIDDIEDKTNQTIVSLYKEIEEKRKEKERNIEELRKMLLGLMTAQTVLYILRLLNSVRY